jgi:hypothetical protein
MHLKFSAGSLVDFYRRNRTLQRRLKHAPLVTVSKPDTISLVIRAMNLSKLKQTAKYDTEMPIKA